MATKEKITVHEFTRVGFNVSGTVGPNGANRPDDVLLVKAMFAFIDGGKGDLAVFLGLEKLPWQLPLDKAEAVYSRTDPLGDIILRYQRKFRTLSADGMIHPASYLAGGRHIVSSTSGGLMTITRLHLDCVGQAAFYYPASGVGYTNYLMLMGPLFGRIRDLTRS